MFNWLMNHVFDRQTYREMQVELENFERLTADIAKIGENPLVKMIDEEDICRRYPHLRLQCSSTTPGSA